MGYGLWAMGPASCTIRNQARNSLTGIGGSFTARPREAEIGVRVAGLKEPAYVFEKNRADLPRPSNPEAVFMQERHICRPL